MPRSSAVRLFGDARPATSSVNGFPCGAASGLSFQWTGETGGGGDSIPLGFANQANAKTLYLPPKFLQPDVLSRFTFSACYAGNPAAVLCGTAVKAFQAVTSPIVAVIGGGNTAVGEGSVVTLDASRSFDPDSAAGSSDAGGSPLAFQWACTPPASLPGPCQAATGAAALDPAALAAPAALLALRGTPQGANYTLTVTVSKDDRTAVASVWLVVLAGKRLPIISVSGLPEGARANPDAKLTVKGSVQSADPASLSVAWSVVSVDPPPAKPFDLAAAASTPLSSPSLVISGGALPPRSTVKLRLSASDSGGSSSADVSLPVSGTPYSSVPGAPIGSVAVRPPRGTGLNTSFTVRAENWTDTDVPLTYAFYYTVAAPAGQAQAQPVLIADFRPQASVSGVLLPAGDRAAGNVVRVFCVVQNAFGASAQSAPVDVEVGWDDSLLADPAKQSALVAEQSAQAMTQVLSGNPDAALSAVSGLSALLAAGAQAQQARRRLAGDDGAAGMQQPTAEEAARAKQREQLLGVVSGVVDVTLPAPTVREEEKEESRGG